MAIEGPLRELGIHDVFQLLDLSRKTEMLLRSGRVTETDLERARAMRSGNGRGRGLGEHLVQCGALSRKELERQMRLQIESVVFELMSSREGFFSFEERAPSELPTAPEFHVSTES